MKGDIYKETIHDGSVSYSIVRPAPLAGHGKHAKTIKSILRRQKVSEIARILKRAGIPRAYAKASAIVYGNR